MASHSPVLHHNISGHQAVSCGDWSAERCIGSTGARCKCTGRYLNRAPPNIDIAGFRAGYLRRKSFTHEASCTQMAGLPINGYSRENGNRQTQQKDLLHQQPYPHGNTAATDTPRTMPMRQCRCDNADVTMLMWRCRCDTSAASAAQYHHISNRYCSVAQRKAVQEKNSR